MKIKKSGIGLFKIVAVCAVVVAACIFGFKRF